jgi:prepilin-type N-terminal cleavage/methylation domain-containing protein
MLATLHQAVRNEHEKRDGGFTLIELLVVIVIVGILAAIAIPIFLNQRRKGVDAGIESDLKSLATAEETVYTDDLEYTTDATKLEEAGFTLTDGNVIQAAITGDGYCLRGSNADGSKDGGDGGYFWYDSLAGGLSSDQPSGGACAGTLTWVTVS